MSTCACGKPTRDDAYLCDDDRRAVTALLAELPWIDEQLEVSLTRQKGASTEGGPRGTETPLPWNDKASMARRALQGTLAAWVGAEGSITALSVRVNVKTLAFHASAYDVLEALDKAAKAARAVIFYKPTPRVYLGRCEGHECACACHTGHGYACSHSDCTQPDAPESREPCEGDVYAPEDDEVGRCQVCGAGYSVAIKRKALEDELDDLLYTATEISHLASFLGLEMSRKSVRVLIDSWHRRGQLTAVDRQGRQGAARFRYGQVKALLYAHKTRREAQ